MNWLVIAFMVLGLFFFTAGTVGLLRFPDVYTRTHGATKCDTLGALLCIVGLMVYNGWSLELVKLFLLIIFIWIANPTAAHLITKAALRWGIPVWSNTREGEDEHEHSL